MAKCHLVLGAMLAACAGPAIAAPPVPATAFSSVALGPLVSTTGLGGELAVPLVGRLLNLNVGVTAFGYKLNTTVDGAALQAKLRLGAVPVYVTLYPFANWFNIQAGVVFDDNRVSALASGPPGGTITINHVAYTTPQLGNVNGATHFNPVAPYVGIGFGQPFAGGPLTFTGSAGVMFEGAPGVQLRASNPAAYAIPGFSSNLAAEQSTINHDAQIAQFYPVVNLAVVYRF